MSYLTYNRFLDTSLKPLICSLRPSVRQLPQFTVGHDTFDIKKKVDTKILATDIIVNRTRMQL